MGRQLALVGILLSCFAPADRALAANGPHAEVSPTRISVSAAEERIPKKYKSVTCSTRLHCTGANESDLRTWSFDKTLTVSAMEPEAADDAGLNQAARRRLARAVALVEHRGVMDGLDQDDKGKVGNGPANQVFCEDKQEVECHNNEPDELLNVYNRTFRSDPAWNIGDLIRHDAETLFGVPDRMYCYYVVAKGRPYLSGEVHMSNSATSDSSANASSSSGSGYFADSRGGFFRRSTTGAGYSFSDSDASARTNGSASSSLHATLQTRYGDVSHLIIEEMIDRGNHEDTRAMRQTACNRAQERYLKGNNQTDVIEDCVCSRERVLPKESIFRYPSFDVLAGRPHDKPVSIPGADSGAVKNLKGAPTRIAVQIKKNQEEEAEAERARLAREKAEQERAAKAKAEREARKQKWIHDNEQNRRQNLCMRIGTTVGEIVRHKGIIHRSGQYNRAAKRYEISGYGQLWCSSDQVIQKAMKGAGWSVGFDKLGEYDLDKKSCKQVLIERCQDWVERDYNDEAQARYPRYSDCEGDCSRYYDWAIERN